MQKFGARFVFLMFALADQNTGGALLEFFIRTAVHGTSRVSSAISVSHNYQNFDTCSSSPMGNVLDHRVISGERSRPLVGCAKHLFRK